MREIDSSLPQHALRIGGTTVGELDIKLARKQHEALTKAIQSTSPDLIIHHLSSDGLPDSVFIEDTVIIVGQTAMITNPGALSRRAETFEVKLFLEETYEDLEVIQQTSGTLDGGDVLFTGQEFFVGLSHRTDIVGINFLAQTFPTYRVTPISLKEFEQILHLKSACSMCGPDHILVGGDLGLLISNKINEISPSTYKITYVHDPEAANCLYINDTLIRRTEDEFPLSADQLASIGGKQLQVGASELAKVDAALTCCSVLFNTMH